MTDQVLLRMLSAGLINVGGDDTKFQKLQEASNDVAALLIKSPSKTLPFALIAMDPMAPADDPVIEEVIGVLQKRWATYANTFAGTPVNVVRAIVLDALVASSLKDNRIAVAFAGCARNVLPFVEGENEAVLWVDLVTAIEQKVDVLAEAEWSTPADIGVPTIQFAPPGELEIKVEVKAVNEDWLRKQIEAAVGPTNAQGEATNGNAHLPNQPQAWVNGLAPILTKALATALNNASKSPSFGPVDIGSPIQQLFDAVGEQLNLTVKGISDATAGLQRRTNLIWWKESLFSPTLRRSYRQFSGTAAATLMAYDLFQQLPTFSPASVVAFLEETVQSHPAIPHEAKRPISAFVDDALSSKDLEQVRSHFSAEHQTTRNGRAPIVLLLSDPSFKVSAEEFRARVGISADTPLTIVEWAAWVFRELQSIQAVYESPSPKRRGRKAQ